MKWINLLLLIANQVFAFDCISRNTSYLSISEFSNVTWIRDLTRQNDETTLSFNPGYDMSMNEWILNNSWGIEEWAKDGKQHFKTYFDKELNTNVLRNDIHSHDGDGSNQKDATEGKRRVRQEIKVYDKSDDVWKIRFGDYIYFKLMLKFDEKFDYDLTHFYHVFQLKPMDDVSHMPVFTISTIRQDIYLSFNTIKNDGDSRPSFNLYKVIKRSEILGLWLHVEVYFHPVRHGTSEILFIVRGLCGKTLHQSYITGKLYQDSVSHYIRPKIGQYHKYMKDIPYVNKVYYANITTKKLKIDTHNHRRSLFDVLLGPIADVTPVVEPTTTTETVVYVEPATTVTVTKVKPTTVTTTRYIKPITVTTTKYIKPTTKHTTSTKHTTKHTTSTKHTTKHTTKPTTTTTTSSFQSTCINYLNKFRASIGKPALVSATADQIACADRSAINDASAGFHNSFYSRMCSSNGQCECMGTPSVTACIDMYIREGPGGGHYDIISGNSRAVACGQDGRGFITHDFY